MAEDDETLRLKHPGFAGDLSHLRRFQQVLDSPPATPARGEALAAWRAFNTVTVVPERARRLEEQQRESCPDRRVRPKVLKKVASWTAYRGKRGVDLRGVDCASTFLGTVDLGKARLDGACFAGARLRAASLHDASLVKADLTGALLLAADLRRADLSGAQLAGSNLRDGDLGEACLDGADLRGADLTRCSLVGASIDGARLDGARVYGVSAWKLRGRPASSDNLTVTPDGEPALTTDRLWLAQFLYLLLAHEGMRDVIDTLSSKTVLLLGRFTPERKSVLDAMRTSLRDSGYVPLLFDFDKPASKSVSDTVRLLAQMARFVVVDLSDPASAPFELGLLVHLGLDRTPLVPVIVRGQAPFSMFDDVQTRNWVLPLVTYRDTTELLARLAADVVDPAELAWKRLRA
jgi:uncharacterized protein YjbI with pentapeptide repeats